MHGGRGFAHSRKAAEGNLDIANLDPVAVDVNLTGPYLMTREVVAQMLERDVRPALIVNISSISGAGNAGQSN